MAGVRQYLVAQLTSHLQGWSLIPWDDVPMISGKTVVFYRSKVVPAPEAPLGKWEHTITLYVATAKQAGEAALDDLDEALDEVLLALHEIPGVSGWTATYTTLNSTWPAFKVDTTVLSNLAPTQE